MSWEAWWVVSRVRVRSWVALAPSTWVDGSRVCWRVWSPARAGVARRRAVRVRAVFRDILDLRGWRELLTPSTGCGRDGRALRHRVAAPAAFRPPSGHPATAGSGHRRG